MKNATIEFHPSIKNCLTFSHCSLNQLGTSSVKNVLTELKASGIVSVKKSHTAPHTSLATSLIFSHAFITAFLKSSFVFHRTTIPATKPAIAATINPIGFANSSIFNNFCTTNHASVAVFTPLNADTNFIIILATFIVTKAAPIPAIPAAILPLLSKIHANPSIIWGRYSDIISPSLTANSPNLSAILDILV